MSSVVLTPFIGAHDMLSIGHHGWLVEALSERIFDQGSRHDMMTTNPTVDIAQQLLSLFNGDAALQDPGVASLVEFTVYKDKGLGAMREPLSLCFIRRQHLTKEVVEVRRPPVGQRIGLCHWILVKLHDFGVGWSRWLVSP